MRNILKKRNMLSLIAMVCTLVLLLSLAPVSGYAKEKGADDGGSGMYYGFGCAFRVKVRLTPDSPKPTVVAYNAYILGIPVYRGIE